MWLFILFFVVGVALGLTGLWSMNAWEHRHATKAPDVFHGHRS